MNRKSFVVASFLISFLLLSQQTSPCLTRGQLSLTDKVHNRDSGLSYATIQEAIDADETENGHTILLDDGTFYEHVVVDKAIALVGAGEGSSIVNGGGSGTIVHVVQVNGASLTRLTVRNSGGYSYSSISYGLHLTASVGCNVSECVFRDSYYGIGLTDTSESFILNNSVLDNSCGVNLDNSSSNKVSFNTVTGNIASIHVQSSVRNEICNNTIQDGSYFPISLGLSSNENVVTYNFISRNNGTIYVTESDNNTIQGNVLLQNTFGGIELYKARCNLISNNNVTASLDEDLGAIQLSSSEHNLVSENFFNTKKIGVDLLFSDYNTVQRNAVSGSTYWGIDVSISSGNLIISNTVTDCKRAVTMLGNSTHGINNTFYHNNFINNTYQIEQIGENGHHWDNGVEGNYWSDYTRQDMDGDGIGDRPYEIDENNRDNYPLAGMCSDFTVNLDGSDYHVLVVCNATVTGLRFDSSAKTMALDTDAGSGPIGCRICFPTNLTSGTPTVLVNQREPVSQRELPLSNETHSYLYLVYGDQGVPVWRQLWLWSLVLSTLFFLSGLVYFVKRRKASTHSEDSGEELGAHSQT